MVEGDFLDLIPLGAYHHIIPSHVHSSKHNDANVMISLFHPLLTLVFAGATIASVLEHVSCLVIICDIP